MNLNKALYKTKKEVSRCSTYPFFAAILAISLTLGSCEKEAVETPEAIKERIASYDNCTCGPYIDLYTWRGKKVYLLAYTGPACNWVPGYFDEEGEPIRMADGYTLQMFALERELIKPIWKCE